MSRQWLEATSAKFINHEHFRKEFLATWWSAAQQGLTKCNLYQSKYDPSTGLSLSAHFLKHVTTASYLEPKLSDREVIEAIRCHYPSDIQRLLVTNQNEHYCSFGGLKTVGNVRKKGSGSSNRN
jgi:hypothetical protein